MDGTPKILNAMSRAHPSNDLNCYPCALSQNFDEPQFLSATKSTWKLLQFYFTLVECKKGLIVFGHNLEIATIVRESAAAVDFFSGKPTEAKLVKAKNWRNRLFRLQLANMSLRENNQFSHSVFI